MTRQPTLQYFFQRTSNPVGFCLYKHLLTKYKKQVVTKKQKPITLRELRQFLRCNLQYELSFSQGIIELNLHSLQELGIIKYLRQPDHSIVLTFVAASAEQVPGLAQSLTEI